MRVPIHILLATLTFLIGNSSALRAAENIAVKPPTIACNASDQNLKTYLQIHKVLFTERDVTRVAEFYAPEVISHNVDQGGDGTRKVTTSQMAAMWAASKKNNPDRVLADDLIICSGDYVIVRTMVHNADTIGQDGNPPTGKAYLISAIDIYRFKDGKVVERWGNSDLVSMYRQIGYVIVPPRVSRLLQPESSPSQSSGPSQNTQAPR